MFQSLSAYFWSPRIWLPANVTWTDLTSTEHVQYATFSDQLYGFPVAACFIVFYFICFRYFWSPIGRYFGLRSKNQKPLTPNPTLEKVFRQNRKVSDHTLKQLTKQLDLSQAYIVRWLRYRKLNSNPSRLYRFSECGCQFIYYICMFVYGVYIMPSKSWFVDVRECFIDLPRHPIDDQIWWYYMASFGYYWCVTFIQLLDSHRKDFYEMLVHHCISLLLLFFSWSCNLFRVGSLVIFIHDIGDIFLLSTKMFIYLQWDKWAITDLAIFTVVWIVTRLIMYPYWILYMTTYRATYILDIFPAYYIFNSMLVMLFILHCVWTYFIFLMWFRIIKCGQLIRDSRSDDSCDEECGESSTHSSCGNQQTSRNSRLRAMSGCGLGGANRTSGRLTSPSAAS